ncbi:MAG TPA: hypothetical protein VMI31_17355 [Fimbriimonadaceae bacterium]|nr:hypothetical protein [Fimbriimonadaceae bacterium]
MREFEFEAGDDFFESLLTLGDHRLLVTHTQGMFVVNSRGRVVRSLIRQAPKQAIVRNGKIGWVHNLPGPFEEGPGNRLVAKAWNTRTIAATYQDQPSKYLTIISADLRRLVAVYFADSRIVRVAPIGKAGWSIELLRGIRSEFLAIDNNGHVRFRNPKFEVLGLRPSGG